MLSAAHSRLRYIVILVITLSALAPAIATAQGRRPGTGRPQSPGRSEERRRPDGPRAAPEAATLSPVSAIPLSGDYRIDALVSGYKWSASTITYSFYEQDVFAGTYYGTEVVSEVSEPVKANVRAIMAWYATALNLTFIEVPETSSTVGLIRIMRSTAPSYAYAYYPSGSSMFSVSGDVHLNPSYDYAGGTNGFQNPAGEHGYTTLIHEIGHALGLKHPHDGAPTLPTTEDNHTRTVMSYSFPGESPGTPMGYDLLALQYLYGARAYRTSNDTYRFTRASIDQYSVGGQVFISPTLTTKQVIWDTGGHNVLDLSGFAASASGYRIDLNPLGWLSTTANYLTSYLNAGAVLGPGVVVQRLVNSGSNDTVIASAAANVFGGYSADRVTGTDVIYGATTADSLDLSGYTPGQVFSSSSGNDLLLNFGTNGSVRLKDYYLDPSNQPAILYTALTPTVSLRDVTVTEGSSSTTANFLVTLSVPAAAPVTISYATVNGTAQAGTDYVATNGVLTFAPGETSKVVLITVLGDLTVENDETYLVRLTGPSVGLDILDGEAVGTILNDDEAPNVLPIAVATATPPSGLSPLTVVFAGDRSYDPDGNIVSFRWAFGDGTSASVPNPQHTYAQAGTYAASLTVTDNRGGTGVAQVAVVVTESPATVMHVNDIAMSLVTTGSGRAPRATVSIVTGGGLPVPGAVVTARWSGLTSSSVSGTTDASGRVVLTGRASKRRGTFTVRVTGVTKAGFTYDVGANVETADSITVP